MEKLGIGGYLINYAKTMMSLDEIKKLVVSEDRIIVSFSRKQLQNKCRKYCKPNASIVGCSDKQLIHCNLIFNTDFKILDTEKNK